MKTIIIIAIAAVVASCGPPSVEEIRGRFEVLKIEGCQYFFWEGAYSTLLTHKGNCTNPIHQRVVVRHHKYIYHE